jgi:hypothetical protein
VCVDIRCAVSECLETNPGKPAQFFHRYIALDCIGQKIQCELPFIFFHERKVQGAPEISFSRKKNVVE